jgi:hypothetical protein
MFIGLSIFLRVADGHGYLESPRSRNWMASPTQEGTWSATSRRPPAESCPHCLNKKQSNRVCGIGGAQDYDVWRDSTGIPMAWRSQATLRVGEVFDVTTVLTANHAGKFCYHKLLCAKMNHADGYVCLFTWFFCLFLLSCFPLS